MLRGWLVAGFIVSVAGMPLAGAEAPLGLSGLPLVGDALPPLAAPSLEPVGEAVGGVLDLLAPDAPDVAPDAPDVAPDAGASPGGAALLAPLAPLFDAVRAPIDEARLPDAPASSPDAGTLALPALDVAEVLAEVAPEVPALPPATLPEIPAETGLGGGSTRSPQLPARPAVPGLPAVGAPHGPGPNLGSQTIGADLGPRQGLGEQFQAWVASAFGGAFAWMDGLPPEAKALMGHAALLLMSGLATALALLTGFRHLQKDNLLEHTFRHQVLDLIRAHPGLHLREVARRLGLTATNAAYHLRVLEKHGFIRSERLNGKRVYVPSAGPAEKAKFLAQALLHRGSRARVLETLAAHPGSNQTALAAMTAQHQGAVSWHLRQLVQAGLVREERSPRECRYTLTPLGQELAAGRTVPVAGVAPTVPTLAPAGSAPAALAFK